MVIDARHLRKVIPYWVPYRNKALPIFLIEPIRRLRSRHGR